MLTVFKMMIDRYNAAAYTHNYIWGFEYKKTIYMAFTDFLVMPYVCKLDKASRGAGMSLRFCPTSEQKVLLLPDALPLCSAAYFESLVENSKYNRGEIFEKLVTEYHGQEWKKDNVPFTEGPDVEIEGIPYQVKFQKATFCNEQSLNNLA
jgi:hypothetical protein